MSDQPKGKITCSRCHEIWTRTTRRSVCRFVDCKCPCTSIHGVWDKRPWTFRAEWRGKLLFDHNTGEGVDAAREVPARNRARYRKGRKTSFSDSNCSDALLQDFNVYVKHQDGSDPTQETIDFIARGCEHAVKVAEQIGMLNCFDMLSRKPLVVSHTLGKQPFMRNAGGVFRPNEEDNWPPSISVGCKGIAGGAFAHELGHALDYYHRQRTQQMTSDGISRDALQQLIERCNSQDLDAMLRTTSYKGLSETEANAIRATKIRGRYWRRPCEQFARSFEQIFSYLGGTPENGGQHYDLLRKEKGQWDVDDPWFLVETWFPVVLDFKPHELAQYLLDRTQAGWPA